jgi:hypothetical protein
MGQLPKARFLMLTIAIVALAYCPNALIAEVLAEDAGAWHEYVNSFSKTSETWRNHVAWSLYQLHACQQPIDDRSPCNYFVGRALHRIYEIEDFRVSEDTWLPANQIATYLDIHPDRWTLIGPGKEQQVLAQAQADANAGAAVIAVSKGSSHGHVALILGGKLRESSSWGLYTPNSAAMFLDKPEKSYVGQQLGWAFSNPEQVQLYVYTCSATRLFIKCLASNDRSVPLPPIGLTVF